MSTFDNVSGHYAKKALVQQNAAVKLMGLLNIKSGDAVLDVACGPGHITNTLKGLTCGRVAGIDISAKMIEEAERSFPGIEFRVCGAENMRFKNEFDAVFCNSSFQWFKQPAAALRAMRRALKTGGKLAVACPATGEWSPTFKRVIGRAAERPELKAVFNHWRSPWLFLPEAKDYEKLFEEAGFKPLHFEISRESTEYAADKAYGVYISGAANGFTGRDYYDTEITDDYINRFNAAVKEEIEKASGGGMVTVDFNRLYYIGQKTITNEETS